MVAPDRPQMTIWRMHNACRIPNATNTHTEHVIPIAFPQQQWWHERPFMLHYTYEGWNFNFGNTPLDSIQELLE